MFNRLLKLFLGWYIIQQLKGAITESAPSWADGILLFIAHVIQHQMKPVLAGMDYTKLPRYATKPMFGILSFFLLGCGLAVWFVPLYMMFIEVLLVGWDTSALSSHFQLLLHALPKGSFFVAPALYARLRLPQLEEWADSIWGPSSQSYIDFCNRQIFILKVGAVYSIAFPTLFLVLGKLYEL
ncbi:MAG: hypothetical protein OXG26_15195 [Caldilineaceae bacterium]|nr:hypothetical protein [Caldilineaceae bacterium]